MKLRDYLDSRGESEAAFARRAGLAQRTVNRVANGGGTSVEIAAEIVRASRAEPDGTGGTVRFEDLIPEEQGAA